jgi:phosphoribosylformimino-5-aminoimidazole carboxamide ribotide isomerase
VSTFELLPAIDLRGGRVVRLIEGDFARETRYGDEPRDVARRFVDAGATWIHVVDLDGARAGEPRQLELIAGVTGEVLGQAHVELGGGLRTAGSVAGALAAGVSRVAVGTAAVRDPAFAARIVARHGPDRVAASIDVRDGVALGDGWRTGAPGLPAVEAVSMLADAGVTTFEVTAIERDGRLEGPDLGLLGALVALGRGRIIASGGIASIEDVLAVQAAGCAGAIVGRALYEGRIDLAALVAVLGTAGQ